ncbi:glycosyltransferase family 2 protein [Microbacterium sp. QXD-8]|uniref:4,4'-diaponeurosporenoate glycosyltransferase n=1 Tax=Microbacterium psychrotolerans TaxID=3068321 RepID=A0ABU0Z565_9MICO|nr:glycosyltransferase family 2 protein [Microbacterium sp. QXD-8]MDQ7879725.1 glycosyltransferase family 2 protein [Microbacterium sp. QXD-8]
MPDTPRISVVIPVKDDDTELARCLRALAQQSRPADEVIVVDNGSTDASADVARAFGARLVRCETPGIPAASAAGYDASTGDIILRLDADCVPDASWIRAMADAFASRPDVSAFTGGARFIDGPRALRVPLATLYLGAYAAVMIPTLGHLPLFGSNLGMRRQAWLGIRSRVHLDAALHDDMDLSFHLGERGRIRHLRAARMGMSMRPFAPGRAFGRRAARGLRTVLVHFPRDFPPVRWTRHALRRLGASRPPRRHARPQPGHIMTLPPRLRPREGGYDTRPSPGRETRSQR